MLHTLYHPAIIKCLSIAGERRDAPMVFWLGDRPKGIEDRTIAANLAKLFGGALFVDTEIL